MTAEYEIISRGVYRHTQIENFVSVGQYSFVRKDEKKYLALRFENKLDTQIDCMSFTVLQMNSSGEIIDRTFVSYSEIFVGVHEEFSHSSMIRVRLDCVDFEIVFDELRSRELVYTVSGGRAIARYDGIDPALDNIDSAQASRLPQLPKKHRYLMRFLALIAVAAIIGGSVFYLVGEISKENDRRREESAITTRDF